MRWFFPSLPYQINLAVRNTEFHYPQPLMRLVTALVPREALFNASALTIIYWVAMTAGVLALIGLGTRPALLVYALCYGFFVSHAYSYGDVHIVRHCTSFSCWHSRSRRRGIGSRSMP